MPKRVLIADDDKSVLKLYARLFSGENYIITMADSFAGAANLIESNSYDLLITDLMLQDGLGTELIRLFNKKRAGAKSLLVTGSPDADAILKGTGITEYIEKPFKVEGFMALVAKSLGGAEG